MLNISMVIKKKKNRMLPFIWIHTVMQSCCIMLFYIGRCLICPIQHANLYACYPTTLKRHYVVLKKKFKLRIVLFTVLMRS